MAISNAYLIAWLLSPEGTPSQWQHLLREAPISEWNAAMSGVMISPDQILACAKSLRKLGIHACNRNTAFLHTNLHYIE